MADRWLVVPVRIALAYAAFAGAWIFLSDRVIERLVTDPHALTLAQTWKGLGFVAVTTALLYLLLRRELVRRANAERDRQRLDRQLRGVLESMTDGFVALDREWRYLYVNRHAGEMLGRDPESLMGGNIWELFPEGVGQPFYHAYHEAMNGGRAVRIEEHYAPWGRWFENRIYPVPDGIAIFFQDISERKAAEAALRESEERFHLLVEGVTDHAIYMLDPQGRVLTWNRGAERIKGYPAAEIVGHSFECFYTEADRRTGLPQRALERATTEGRFEGEGWRLRRDGSTFWASVSITALRDEQGRLRGFAKITRDITERRMAEQTLAAYAERLELLSRQLLEAQENERRHIARELHDEVGQLLTAVTLGLQSACRHPDARAVAPALAASVESVERVLARVRDLSLDLRPSLLDDLGLVPALRWYAERQARQSGVPVQLVVRDAERRFPSAVETACFRIAQEALTNALRHAGAGAVDIALRAGEGAIEVEVRDDGAGFDAAAARERAARGGSFGLLGMQERAELAGGTLAVESAPGQGTTVRACFPLPPEAA